MGIVRHWAAFAACVLATTVSGAVFEGVDLSNRIDRNQRRSTALDRMPSEKYEVTWEAALFIPAKDGTMLRADGFVPKPTEPNETFPVVIFPNSWDTPQIEYLVRARDLAKRGYLTLEYETRGWYSSGGEIDVAGPQDRSDGSVMIDFMASQTQWNPDMSSVAFAGISYGAGISLMMAGYDPRVVTAVVMSGWNNLTDMLYGNEVPNKDALSGLVGSAEANGHPQPNLSTMVRHLDAHQNMDTLVKWAAQRTPQAFLDVYNTRQVPLFLSSNYLDQLFRPQYMLDFFPLLKGPKHLLLNWGRHAVPEAIGIFDGHSKIWTEAFCWLDHYLKALPTGVESWPLIEAQHGGSMADPYVNLSDATAATTSWYFGARVNGQGFGTMTMAPGPSGIEAPITFTTDVGLRQPSATGQTLGELKTTNLTQQNPATTLVYETEPLANSVTVCGTPTLDLEFTATAPNWQFYPYLYAVGTLQPSEGVYMSYGFKNHYASGPTSGPVAESVGPSRWVLKGLQMHTICLTVPAGDRLAFGIVLYSPNFSPANNQSSLGLSMIYGANTNIHLPTPSFPS